MTQPRSSLAMALIDYKGPRPGIALTIAAVALIAALIVGSLHVIGLGQAGAAINESQQTMRTLHSYNAAFEVWRSVYEMGDSALQFEAEIRQRDSLATALRGHLSDLQVRLGDPIDQALVDRVIGDLQNPGETRDVISESGRAAMVVLMARQDSALFQTAADYQRSQFLAAIFIALTVIAAGVLIIPMSWVYIRYKRGVPPGL